MKKSSSYSLSENDIRKALKGNVQVIGYSELKKYSNIEDVFSKSDNVVILYINTDKNWGHWTLLMRHPDRIEFFDSYGGGTDGQPDGEFKYIDPRLRKDYNYKGRPYLSSLLEKYAERGGKVEYNDHQLQEQSDKIATCGRHVVVRALCKSIPIDEYAKMIKTIGNPDSVVTQLTYNLI